MYSDMWKLRLSSVEESAPGVSKTSMLAEIVCADITNCVSEFAHQKAGFTPMRAVEMQEEEGRFSSCCEFDIPSGAGGRELELPAGRPERSRETK
jgi:hypothetical protein